MSDLDWLQWEMEVAGYEIGDYYHLTVDECLKLLNND